MSVFRLCERAVGMVRGNRLVLNSAERNMLDALNYEGLANAHAQDEAVACARHFAFVRDSLLQQYPFIFARKNVYMTLTNTEMAGWKYVYTLPNDCLRPLQFVANEWGLTRGKYELAGRLVGANENRLALRYTAAQPNTETWAHTFATCFCFALAAEIATAVTGALDVTNGLTEQLKYNIAEAYRVGDIGETPGMTLDTSEFWGGYSINKPLDVPFPPQQSNLLDGGVWF